MICNHSFSPKVRGSSLKSGASAGTKQRPSKLSCYSWQCSDELTDRVRSQSIRRSIVAAANDAARVSFRRIAGRADAAPVATAQRNHNAESQYDRRATATAATAPMATAVDST
jgi:hypothetical protein